MILRLLSIQLYYPTNLYTELFTVDKKIPAGDNAPTTHYQPAAGM